MFFNKEGTWEDDPLPWQQGPEKTGEYSNRNHHRVTWSSTTITWEINGKKVAEIPVNLQFNNLVPGVFVLGRQDVWFDNFKVLEQLD